MTKKRALEDIVRKVVLERFDDVETAEIRIDHGKDQDGDPVIYVKIVLEDADMEKIEAGRAVGMVRHFLPKMIKAGYEGFPIPSFIKRSELRKQTSEAA